MLSTRVVSCNQLPGTHKLLCRYIEYKNVFLSSKQCFALAILGIEYWCLQGIRLKGGNG